MLGYLRMQVAFGSAAQMFVMAAIVTTALFVPIGATIALLAIMVLRVPLAAVVTFGGWLPPIPGLAAWWLILFVPALVYAGYAMPWHDDE